MIARFTAIALAGGLLFGCAAPQPPVPEVQGDQSVEGAAHFQVDSTPKLRDGYYVLEVEVHNYSDYPHMLLSLDARLVGDDGQQVGNANCFPLSEQGLYTPGHGSFTLGCPASVSEAEGFKRAEFYGLEGRTP